MPTLLAIHLCRARRASRRDSSLVETPVNVPLVLNASVLVSPFGVPAPLSSRAVIGSNPNVPLNHDWVEITIPVLPTSFPNSLEEARQWFLNQKYACPRYFQFHPMFVHYNPCYHFCYNKMNKYIERRRKKKIQKA